MKLLTGVKLNKQGEKGKKKRSDASANISATAQSHSVHKARKRALLASPQGHQPYCRGIQKSIQAEATQLALKRPHICQSTACELQVTTE